ncbi:MAG TPA: radical SAM protein, partial [bacterium]|nr:radical SAM protein [bacterium]
MERFTCTWIHDILVVLCDGKVVCGCADPYGERPLGDANTQTLHEIWRSPRARAIREGLNRGHAPFCVPCGLRCPLSDGDEPPQRPKDPEHMSRLFIESTVLCNLDCYKSVCNKASGIVKTRSRPMMDMDLFKRIVDEAGPHLVRLDLFNYGETFVHPQAVDMVEYFKGKFPRPVLYISTNGLMLDEAKIDRLVAAGVDELTFSVDGADQATYEKYRIGGDFERVRDLMAYCVAARNRHGAEVPYINWRYIIFKWNDADAQMDAARRMAADIGVDRLTWEITDHPADAMSHRYQPGTPDWQRIYHEIWDTSHLSNAIPGKQYRAVIEPKAMGPMIFARRNRTKSITVTVKNAADMPWFDRTATGRRLVRLGAQLHDRKRALINRDYARAFLPRTLGGSEGVAIELELPPVDAPGVYWLKFDMVS